MRRRSYVFRCHVFRRKHTRFSIFSLSMCDRLEKEPFFGSFFYGKNTIQPIHTIKMTPAITAGNK